jgi:hypothetical protein
MKPAQTTGEHITLTTRIPPEQVLQRLSHAIEKRTPILPFQVQPKHWLFVGSIQGSSFSISRIPSGKRLYENKIDGVVDRAEHGSIIKLVIQPHSMSVLIGYSAATMAAFWIALVGGSLLYGFISGLLSPGFGSFLVIVGLFGLLQIYGFQRPPSKLDLDAVTALGHLKSIWQAEVVDGDVSSS